MNPTDEQLPFRLKESTFRLYEPYVQAAITQSPSTVYINPAPLRPSTFAARLRDAKLSYEKFGWSASFTKLEYDETERTGGLTVSHTDQHVSIGPKLKAGKRPGETLAFQNPNDKRLDGIFVDQPLQEPAIVAFCLLLSQRLISGPVILRKQHDWTPELTDKLEASYDVAITFNEQSHVIII